MIEVFADIWCPFTHVSLRKLVEARAEGRLNARLRVRAWPLELVNGRPLSPPLVAEEIAELQAHVDSEAFTGFDRDRFPKTMLPALRLSAIAYDRSVDVGEAVALELRHRLFEQGEDVSDEVLLREVSAAHELDADASPSSSPEEDWEEGKRRGVAGSPHFFTANGDFFCPSLDVEKVDGRVRVRPDPGGLATLLASIGGPNAAQS
jgi:predicted DsbA family dithiol-disulfide isomerase